MDNQFTNPYTSTYAPSGFEQQNQQGMNPVFQNTNAQQQYLAGQLREQQALAQPQAQKQAGSISPMDLAKMLRQGTPNNSDMPNSVSPYDANSLSNPYAQTNLYGAN